MVYIDKTGRFMIRFKEQVDLERPYYVNNNLYKHSFHDDFNNI